MPKTRKTIRAAIRQRCKTQHLWWRWDASEPRESATCKCGKVALILRLILKYWDRCHHQSDFFSGRSVVISAEQCQTSCCMKIRQLQLWSVEQFKSSIQQKWTMIPLAKLPKLKSWVPKRLKSVIRRKGDMLHYLFFSSFFFRLCCWSLTLDLFILLYCWKLSNFSVNGLSSVSPGFRVRPQYYKCSFDFWLIRAVLLDGVVTIFC